jgi:hypothetical protein
VTGLRCACGAPKDSEAPACVGCVHRARVRDHHPRPRKGSPAALRQMVADCAPLAIDAADWLEPADETPPADGVG